LADQVTEQGTTLPGVEAAKQRDKETPRETSKDKAIATAPSPAPKESELSVLLRDLKDSRKRTAAAHRIGELGSKARSASEAICAELASPGLGKTDKETLLDALEKIHPELHRHVLVLVIEPHPFGNPAAIRGIQLMGKSAEAATPLLIAQPLTAHTISALSAVGLTRPETIKFIAKVVEKPPEAMHGFIHSSWYSSDVVRAAIRALRQLAKEEPTSRREIAGLFQQLLQKERKFGPFLPDGAQILVVLIEAIAELGVAGKIALPELRKDRFNPNNAIRDAARKAVTTLEGID
jgi:hypothetical protein